MNFRETNSGSTNVIGLTDELQCIYINDLFNKKNNFQLL